MAATLGAVLRLVVLDDDPLTREMVVASAAAHGFDAVAASTIAEVDALLADNKGPMAILSDVDLRAGQSGIGASLGWAEQHQDVQIVFMSGHAPDMIADFAQRPPGSVFLQKPFGFEQLIEALSAG